MNTIAEMQKRVKRGIKFLDKELGRKKWAKKIKLNKLNLGNAATCVIGEIYGDYGDGLDTLNKSKAWGRNNGFNLPVVASAASKDDEFRVLTRIWREMLVKEGIK